MVRQELNGVKWCVLLWILGVVSLKRRQDISKFQKPKEIIRQRDLMVDVITADCRGIVKLSVKCVKITTLTMLEIHRVRRRKKVWSAWACGDCLSRQKDKGRPTVKEIGQYRHRPPRELWKHPVRPSPFILFESWFTGWVSLKGMLLCHIESTYVVRKNLVYLTT